MTPIDLREEIVIELEALETIVKELVAIHADVADRACSTNKVDVVLTGSSSCPQRDD